MAEQNNNNGIKQVLLILMSLVFLGVTYFIFSKYVFKTDTPSINFNLNSSANTEATVARIQGKIRNIKPIESDFFETEKFNGLREIPFIQVNISSFKKGKENPFLSKLKDDPIEKKSEEDDTDIETEEGRVDS